MRKNFATLFFPLIAGTTCALYVTGGNWDEHAAKLLTALSVMGAAVLVRLARGLSMPTGDALETDEARTIAKAIQTMIRRLRLLIFVILGTMVVLVGLPGISRKIAIALPIDWQGPTLSVASGIIGFAIAYVLVRMVQVVNSDVDLVEVQVEVYLKSLAKKDQKKYDDARAAGTVAPFRAPEGYGKKIS